MRGDTRVDRVNLFKKLAVEANVQTQLIKFPFEFASE